MGTNRTQASVVDADVDFVDKHTSTQNVPVNEQSAPLLLAELATKGVEGKGHKGD